MCHPKPGPRCSAHARFTLRRAERRLHDARETMRQDPTDGERITAVEEAQAAYVEAKAAWHATPDGFEALREGIERARQRNDVEEAARIEQILHEAQIRRHAALAALAGSREGSVRDPFDQAALDRVDGNVEEAQEALRAATVDFEEADRVAREARGAHEAAEATVREAQERVEAAEDRARQGEAEAQDAAIALYTRAGVNPRMAGFYASDMSEAARRLTRDRSGDVLADYPVGPLAMKIKRNGPDADRTRVAAEAAVSDERFVRANAEISAALVARRDAVRDRADARDAAQALEPSRLMRARSQARDVRDNAADHLAYTKAVASDLHARVDAGIGAMPDALSAPTSLVSARDQIRRAPDGSINAWVRREPSPGYPHGRYVRASGVARATSPAQRGVACNVLVLEDGSHVMVTGQGRQSRVPQVYLGPSVEGSRRLVDECEPNAGFSWSGRVEGLRINEVHDEGEERAAPKTA